MLTMHKPRFHPPPLYLKRFSSIANGAQVAFQDALGNNEFCHPSMWKFGTVSIPGSE